MKIYFLITYDSFAPIRKYFIILKNLRLLKAMVWLLNKYLLFLHKSNKFCIRYTGGQPAISLKIVINIL